MDSTASIMGGQEELVAGDGGELGELQRVSEAAPGRNGQIGRAGGAVSLARVRGSLCGSAMKRPSHSS